MPGYPSLQSASVSLVSLALLNNLCSISLDVFIFILIVSPGVPSQQAISSSFSNLIILLISYLDGFACSLSSYTFADWLYGSLRICPFRISSKYSTHVFISSFMFSLLGLLYLFLPRSLWHCKNL